MLTGRLPQPGGFQTLVDVVRLAQRTNMKYGVEMSAPPEAGPG